MLSYYVGQVGFNSRHIFVSNTIKGKNNANIHEHNLDYKTQKYLIMLSVFWDLLNHENTKNIVYFYDLVDVCSKLVKKDKPDNPVFKIVWENGTKKVIPVTL